MSGFEGAGLDHGYECPKLDVTLQKKQNKRKKKKKRAALVNEMPFPREPLILGDGL